MSGKLLGKSKNLALLAVLVFFVYGCGSGGGGSQLGSLFSSGGSVVSGLQDGGDIPGDPGDLGDLGDPGDPGDPVCDPLEGTTNPEPATMLLLGSGILAMGYFRKRKN